MAKTDKPNILFTDLYGQQNLGYATGQFGKNHLGDRNEFLPKSLETFKEFPIRQKPASFSVDQVVAAAMPHP